jgi:ribonuclease HII
VASRERIDRINILRASLWAMSRAVRGLSRTPDHVMVDGNMLPPHVGCSCEAIVDGDALSISIAAASIVAKVTRDRLMAHVGKAYPLYGFENHVGYSTPEHCAALVEHGPCPHHRLSFARVMAQQLELGLADPAVAPAAAEAEAA